MHGHNYIASSAHLWSRESHPPHGGSARRLQHPEQESGVSHECCIDIPVMIFQSDPRIPEPGRVRAIETELLQLNCVSCDP